MQENNVYEYAVIRIVPQVEREEFMNVGVMVYCPKQAFLETAIYLNEKRLIGFAKELDVSKVQDHLQAWQRICAADPSSGPIARLSIGERFRWLTAARSTILQTSKVHIGYCGRKSAQQTLKHLLETFVK